MKRSHKNTPDVNDLALYLVPLIDIPTPHLTRRYGIEEVGYLLVGQPSARSVLTVFWWNGTCGSLIDDLMEGMAAWLHGMIEQGLFELGKDYRTVPPEVEEVMLGFLHPLGGVKRARPDGAGMSHLFLTEAGTQKMSAAKASSGLTFIHNPHVPSGVPRGEV